MQMISFFSDHLPTNFSSFTCIPIKITHGTASTNSKAQTDRGCVVNDYIFSFNLYIHLLPLSPLFSFRSSRFLLLRLSRFYSKKDSQSFCLNLIFSYFSRLNVLPPPAFFLVSSLRCVRMQRSGTYCHSLARMIGSILSPWSFVTMLHLLYYQL